MPADRSWPAGSGLNDWEIGVGCEVGSGSLIVLPRTRHAANHALASVASPCSIPSDGRTTTSSRGSQLSDDRIGIGCQAVVHREPGGGDAGGVHGGRVVAAADAPPDRGVAEIGEAAGQKHRETAGPGDRPAASAAGQCGGGDSKLPGCHRDDSGDARPRDNRLGRLGHIRRDRHDQAGCQPGRQVILQRSGIGVAAQSEAPVGGGGGIEELPKGRLAGGPADGFEALHDHQLPAAEAAAKPIPAVCVGRDIHLLAKAFPVSGKAGKALGLGPVGQVIEQRTGRRRGDHAERTLPKARCGFRAVEQLVDRIANEGDAGSR